LWGVKQKEAAMANRLLLLALLFSITGSPSLAQDPAGAEFRVNTYTSGGQYLAAVAADANGNFVVVWQGYGDGNSSGVFGQRFNAAGFPQGGEFQVNSYTTSAQRLPAVASDARGNFVVVWESYAQDGSRNGVFGQRFHSGGLPLGSEFRVNSYTTQDQGYFPVVASDASGNFVVVWASRYQDGSGPGIFAQRFNAAGLPQGPEFPVNSYTTSAQRFPAVASDANGNFVVVWESSGQDGSGAGVFGQRFHAFGLPLESEFQINSFTTNFQRRPAVASDANGDFVVVWQSDGQDGSLNGVFGQRFNASGVPQGGNFRANTYFAGNQHLPAVGADASGNFVVAWVSDGQDGSSVGIFGQRFDAVGLPQGPEFQVNSYTTSHQYYPAVASAANGNFVVAWESFLQDGSDTGIFGQRYGDLIFEDGFQ
jgi:hypothetical protein